MLYAKRIFIVCVMLFTMGHYSQAQTGNFWLGMLDLAPGATSYSKGAIYYDKAASRLKTLTGIKDLKPVWQDIAGESSYETIVAVSETDNKAFVESKTANDCIKSAIAAINNASEKNRCAVIVLPGTYELKENVINCREYVDIIGIKDYSVIKNRGATTVKLANNCGLVGLSLSNAGASKKSTCIEYRNISSFSFISDCVISSKYNAVECSDSPFVNITGCSIASTGGSGIVLKESEATLFNSSVSGRPNAVECLQNSKATLYNSLVPGIYISKDSKVELNKCDTKNIPVKGQKNAAVVISSTTVPIPVSPEVSIQKQKTITRAKIMDNSNKKKTPSREDKKECPCKEKQQPATALEPDFVYNRIFKEKDANTLLVDVRSADSYEQKHIKNAINVPSTVLMENLKQLPKEKEIVVYCSNIKCTLSEEFLRTLYYLGYINVKYLKGGLEDWEKCGYPVVTRKL